MKTRTGFDLERQRIVFLREKKIKKLLETYQKGVPQITDINSSAFWDYIFSSDDQTLLFPMARHRNNIVASLCQKNQRILNLGSGKGFLEQFLCDRFHDEIKLTGTDITQQTLSTLQKRFPSYQFLRTPLFPLPFQKNSFDVVCLLEVLEHIQPHETFAVLSEIFRVLAPKGKVYISVPINEGLEEMMPNNPNAHVRVYTEELVQFELEQIGFHVQKVFRFTAFDRFFSLKQVINDILHLRKSNNLLFVLTKEG